MRFEPLFGMQEPIDLLAHPVDDVGVFKDVAVALSADMQLLSRKLLQLVHIRNNQSGKPLAILADQNGVLDKREPGDRPFNPGRVDILPEERTMISLARPVIISSPVTVIMPRSPVRR